MHQNHQKKSNQHGRSMLELIAVIVLIVLLSFGSLLVYRHTLGKRESNLAYEDLLIQGEALRNRGKATNRNIYDASIGTKSRTGKKMAFCPDVNGNSTTPCPTSDSKFFDITVFDLDKEACKSLQAKDWPADKVALIKINENTYDPTDIQCNGISETFDITVTFWASSVSSVERADPFMKPRLCSAGCLSCQRCENNVCKNTCHNGEFCRATSARPYGECSGCPATFGTYCGSEPSNNMDPQGCPQKAFISCGANQACVNHECVNCSSGAEGESCISQCPNPCQPGLSCDLLQKKCLSGNTCGGQKNDDCTGSCADICQTDLGLVCRNGTCQCGSNMQGSKCSPDCPCANGLSCSVAGVCVPEPPIQCSPTCSGCQECVNGTCQYSSTYQSVGSGGSCSLACQCQAGLTCSNGRCQKETGHECFTAGDCGSATCYTCSNESCQTTSIYHSKASGTACSNNCECQEGFVCGSSGKCQKETEHQCFAANECSACQTCVNESCQTDTNIFHKKASGATCSNSCECQEGFVCGDLGKCEKETGHECFEASDCGYAACYTCSNESCQTVASVFHSKTSGATCSDSCECQEGFVCGSSGKCEKETGHECFTATDCGNTACYSCSNETCQTTNTYHSKALEASCSDSCECQSALCKNNVCIESCHGEQCDETKCETCGSNGCVVNSPSLELMKACTYDCQCKSGKCYDINGDSQKECVECRNDTECSSGYCSSNTGICQTGGIAADCDLAMRNAGFRTDRYSISSNVVTWNPNSDNRYTEMAPNKNLYLSGCDLVINGLLNNQNSITVDNLTINGIPSKNSNSSISSNTGTLNVKGDLTLYSEYKNGAYFDDHGQLTVDGDVNATDFGYYNGADGNTHVKGNINMNSTNKYEGGIVNDGTLVVDGYVNSKCVNYPFSNYGTTIIHGYLRSEATATDSGDIGIDVCSGSLTVDGNITGIASDQDDENFRGISFGCSAADNAVEKDFPVMKSLHGNIIGQGGTGIDFFVNGVISAPNGSVTGTGKQVGIMAGWWGSALIEAKGNVTGRATANGGMEGIKALRLTIKAGGNITGSGGYGITVQDSTIISCSGISATGKGFAAIGITFNPTSDVQVKGQISGSASRADSYARYWGIRVDSGMSIDNIKARSFSTSYSYKDGCNASDGYCLANYTPNYSYTPEWCNNMTFSQ